MSKLGVLLVYNSSASIKRLNIRLIKRDQILTIAWDIWTFKSLIDIFRKRNLSNPQQTTLIFIYVGYVFTNFHFLNGQTLHESLYFLDTNLFNEVLTE